MNLEINILPESLDLDWSSAGYDKIDPSFFGSDGLLFCGDNKEILERLAVQQPHSIDLCYIDPPYNTRNKFIYKDTRSSVDHLIWGSHAEWMEFMKARLMPLRTLLKETGLIAISIDDYEQPYLRVLMDQIFGEKNFIACISTCRSKNGKGSKGSIATNHEYIVVYSKSNKAKVRGFKEELNDSYNKKDEHGVYKINGLFRKKGDASRREDRPNMFYPLYYNSEGKVFTENVCGNLRKALPIDSKGIERRWLWGKDKANLESWKLYASDNGVIYVKNYFNTVKRIKPKSFWSDNRHLTERATLEIKEIYGEKVFETPKPLGLIEDIIESHASKDAVIIDFFAGTGTTAHAAHNLNLADGGKRKVILVEHTTEISKNHIAYKQGFRKISDITEFRLKWISKNNDKYKFKVSI